MLDVNLHDIIQGLEADDLVFSYNLQRLLTPKGMRLTLHQQETGFSLVIQLKKKAGALSVIRFTLNEDSTLEQQSLSLYDAAMVEIVLQALDLLFVVADHTDQPKITFTLSEAEAAHLSSFECFFDKNMTIQISPGAYDTFVNKTEVLKTKIRCELWQRQRHDRYLMNYLQNRQKGRLFSFSQPEQKQPHVSNVIAFPVPSKTAMVEHV